MVLNHVADGPGLIVEASASLYSEVLGHRDLDTVDVVAVPEGFHKSIGETECEYVVHCAFSEVMIDTEYVGFRENTKQNFIQLLRRGKIVPEGLLHNNSTTSGAVGFRKMLHHHFKQNRRYRQVMGWTLCILELFAEHAERRGILIVAVHIAQ